MIIKIEKKHTKVHVIILWSWKYVYKRSLLCEIIFAQVCVEASKR